jgi:hypothetical protein
MVKGTGVDMNFTEHTKMRKEKFGTVIFDTLTEKIFITDQIGGEILQLVEEGKDLAGIVDVLAQDYDCDRGVIEKDVIEFTNELKSSNIVRV